MWWKWRSYPTSKNHDRPRGQRWTAHWVRPALLPCETHSVCGFRQQGVSWCLDLIPVRYSEIHCTVTVSYGRADTYDSYAASAAVGSYISVLGNCYMLSSSRGGVLAGMPRCVPPRTHLGIRRNNRTHTLQNSIQNLTRHSYQYPGVQYPGVYEEHSWVGSGTHVWALNEERAGALGARGMEFCSVCVNNRV